MSWSEAYTGTLPDESHPDDAKPADLEQASGPNMSSSTDRVDGLI